MKNTPKLLLLSALLFLLPFYGKAQSAPAEYQQKLDLLQNMVGKPAPAFTAKTIDGKKVDLASLKGKVIVVNFWFVGCLPCEEEMPLLNKLTDQYKDNPNVVFLAFANSTKGSVKSFFKRKTFKYQTVTDAKAIADTYNVSGYPSHFIIDKEGVLKFASIASQDNIDEFLSGKIQGVLAK
ncbi:TlpA family protein disulfide reductase [Mucilaginibacter glaciei]|uniref:TlpA family protein disulfide reductase n=1 Tax=Mucilaginibacter glaciei TaxID=2772109 RepID=A0A926S3X4_9SPHI|nr:TlpA disulfide reductase family protein [Mucilaginibacter glaciei]MBD1395382.1 TlpA family protein disulfide reductase [Mucilaginibacter glaciei]